MKALLVAAALTALIPAFGCGSGRTKLQEDEKQFHATLQAQQDAAQWKLDDAVATGLFDDGTTAGVSRYLTFRKCHEEPPAHEPNKRTCANLQARVAKAEATEAATQAAAKAKW